MLCFALLATAMSASEIAKRDTFQRKIDSINYYYSVYDTMPGWMGGNMGGDLFESTKENLTRLLLDVLGDTKILKFDLNSAFPQIPHTASADNRIHFFSFDEKTGGSWRTSYTFLHERANNGSVRATFLGEDYFFATYYQVYCLDPKAGKYLALGGVRTCNTCTAEMALFIQPDSTATAEIEAMYDCRYMYSGGMEFDTITKKLTYHYSNRSDDSLYGSSNPSADNEEYDYGEKPVMFSYTEELTFLYGEMVRTGGCWSSEVIE